MYDFNCKIHVCGQTPLEVLEPILREDIQKASINSSLLSLFMYILFIVHALFFIFTLQIWDNIPKPPKHKDTPIGEFFNVSRFFAIFI